MKEAIKYILLIIVVTIINYIIFNNIGNKNKDDNKVIVVPIDTLNKEKEFIDSIKKDRDSIQIVIKYIEKDKDDKIQEMLNADDSIVVSEFIRLVTE